MSRYARDPISGSILPVAGSGHTIVDSSDTVYAQRSKLKFKGLSVIDDSTDDETVVDASPIREEQRVLGAKNLLPNAATTQVYQGITFTVNDDKSVTANGTVTKDISFYIGSIPLLKKGDYILSGCPKEGNQHRYHLLLQTGDDADHLTPFGSDYGEGLTVHLETDAYVVCHILFSEEDQNYDINNLTFYPMLRLASDPDNTYVPYVMTNRELTEDVGTLKTNLKATYNSAEVPFKFGIDANGNYGYIKAGADAVTPFKSGLAIPGNNTKRLTVDCKIGDIIFFGAFIFNGVPTGDNISASGGRIIRYSIGRDKGHTNWAGAIFAVCEATSTTVTFNFTTDGSVTIAKYFNTVVSMQ